MWKEKGKDDMEILIQLTYTMYKLLKQPKSCEETLYGNRVMVTYLMEALDHTNNNVRKAADRVLELVIELDRKPNDEMGTLSNQIRRKRFESYNSQWLQQMEAVDRTSAHDQHMNYHEQETGDVNYYNNEQYGEDGDGASYGSYHGGNRGDDVLFDGRGHDAPNDYVDRREEFDESHGSSGNYDEQSHDGYDHNARSYK